MPNTPPPHRISPRRILVVDDEPLVAQTIRRVLLLHGHNVELAEDAEKALVQFDAGKHDLVITDFKLPKMDGLELAQAIRARVPTQPIILITAYAEKIHASMGKVSNVDVVIGKPFSLEQLQGALATIFAGA